MRARLNATAYVWQQECDWSGESELAARQAGLFSIAAVGDGLKLAVFLFQLSLHVEVELALPLYSLLFHVAKDSCVHCLN